MRLYLDPHGCAKNQVDAEFMLSSLMAAGWEICEDPETADLVIVNSCGFIESAKRESIEALLAWRDAYPGKKIMLAGCLSQRYAADLAAEMPEVDFFFGNGDLSRVGEAVKAVMAGTERILCPPVGDDSREEALAAQDSALCGSHRPILSLPGSAFLKISEGCDNRCTYCAIPLIRGGLRSRPAASILAEARSLIGRGIRELCLVGQDLASYGVDRGETGSLIGLLKELLALDGDVWIRLLYIHPDHFPRELLPLIAEGLSRREREGPGRPYIVPYFDVPFQHASPSILRAMNRRGDVETYLALVEDIRRAVPEATIRSTFLLGFPGETEADVEALLDFQSAARLDWLGAFSWSREEDTPAWGLKGRVAKKIAETRKRRVEEAQQPISIERMARFAGQKMDILIEEKVEGEEGLWLGRAVCQAPEVDGSTVITSFDELPLGGLVPCRIVRVNGFDLDAVPERG